MFKDFYYVNVVEYGLNATNTYSPTNSHLSEMCKPLESVSDYTVQLFTACS